MNLKTLQLLNDSVVHCGKYGAKGSIFGNAHQVVDYIIKPPCCMLIWGKDRLFIKV